MPVTGIPSWQNRSGRENPATERPSEARPQPKKRSSKIDDGIYRGLSRLRDGFCRPKNPAKFFANPWKKIDRV
ncbi:MAG TPA: hypothetical protein VJR29_06015 [bacterium]|nr:hypothetical protein [bacterium]